MDWATKTSSLKIRGLIPSGAWGTHKTQKRGRHVQRNSMTWPTINQTTKVINGKILLEIYSTLNLNQKSREPWSVIHPKTFNSTKYLSRSITNSQWLRVSLTYHRLTHRTWFYKISSCKVNLIKLIKISRPQQAKRKKSSKFKQETKLYKTKFRISQRKSDLPRWC